VVSFYSNSFLNIYVSYHRGSRTNRDGISYNVNTVTVFVDNRGGIIALNFKNVTVLFLIVVPS